MPWAAVAGSVVSGLLSSGSSSDAANGVGKANALTQEQINAQKAENNAAFSPYISNGTAANNKLGILLGLTGGADGKSGNNYTLNDFINWNRYWNKNNGNSATDQQLISNAQKDFATYQQGGFGNDQATHDYFGGGFKAPTFTDYSSDPAYGSLTRGFTSNDLNKDVVYNSGLQFGLDQGTSAINRLAAARGGIDSGATLKALTRYAEDYGSTKAEGAYNRFNQDKNQTYNFLSGQQGVGLNATTSNQGLNNGLVTAGANANMNAAQLQGNYGIMGAEGLNNSIQGGIGNYLYNNRVNNGSVVGGGYGSGSGGGTYGSGYGYSSNSPWLN